MRHQDQAGWIYTFLFNNEKGRATGLGRTTHKRSREGSLQGGEPHLVNPPVAGGKTVSNELENKVVGKNILRSAREAKGEREMWGGEGSYG